MSKNLKTRGLRHLIGKSISDLGVTQARGLETIFDV